MRTPSTMRSQGIAARAAIVAPFLALSASAFGAFSTAPQSSLKSKPLYEQDIAPLLEKQCVSCHGKSGLAGLDLRTLTGILKGGTKGVALVKGAPNKSLLILRTQDNSMPPGDKKLSADQKALLRRWVEQGAPLAKPESAKARPENHWAFRPLVRPSIPKVQNRAWVKTPIDAFILAKLEQKQIPPPQNADKRTLFRRLNLDLTGLPPTPAAVEAYLKDASPNAYEKAVDRLLARPEYGERWARFWLDAVRYAETNGYERDGAKPSAWRYRDYVIDALNKDKPFAQFVKEQIAGDELANSNAETQIATTFLRLGTWDDEPADDPLDRCEQLDDVLGTVSAVFLAQTLRCARCHDHKFEPFSSKDYYRTLALFSPLKRPQNGRTEFDRLVGTEAELAEYQAKTKQADDAIAPHRARLESLNMTRGVRLRDQGRSKLPKETLAALLTPPEKRNDDQKAALITQKEALEKALQAIGTPEENAQTADAQRKIAEIDAQRPKEPPHAYIWMEEGAKAPETRILSLGDPRRAGETVEPGFPAILVKAPLGAPAPTKRSTGRRLWFANWLISPSNPLPARVLVNRLWQGRFGEGIVATENDFGVMGARPTHPELLDWLATELLQNGGSLKSLHRQMVLSNTYRAASAVSAIAQKKDPANLLYSRWSPRRLEAEAVRDSMLATAGTLNPERGGPSVYPKLPQSVLQGQSRPGEGWGHSDERQASRRSIYIYIKRSLVVPELEALDAPDTASSCEQRAISTVAPQALTFLNGEFARTQAQRFAARLQKEAGPDPKAQIARAYQIALCRPPSAQETRAIQAFLTRQQTLLEAEAKAQSKPAQDAKERALQAFCLTLLNSNEFFYLE